MMDESVKQLALLIPQIYKDLAQPALINIGKALGSITGAFVTPTGIAMQVFETNLMKYVKKLEKQAGDRVVEAIPEIAIPVLERLKYTRAEELVELYTELLLKASVTPTQGDAHPAYLEVITNISIDEARILEHIKGKGIIDIPYLEIQVKEEDVDGYKILIPRLTTLENQIDFIYPNNVTMYLVNLCRLGILEDKAGVHLIKKESYDALYDRLEILRKGIKDGKISLEAERSLLRLSTFGQNFINTCLP